ncbi:MAG: glutathione peroxidase [bacterium]|nr:glutathione peroxidase [bacterium]
MNLYEFTARNTKGEEVSLKDYEGKVVLIVNTATGCGFTPQYEELEKLYEDYKEQGFVILDFPCNQFGHQAPGTDDEIVSFCSMKFGVKFPQFSKIEVNGEGAHPLFQFLQNEKPFAGFDPKHPLTPVLEDMFEKADPEFRTKPEIKWNFTKFLVDRSGNVVERFEPTTESNVIENKMKELL